jgi:predicted ATPase/tRNA A-37 threonylcarbamoyl transferase component Bud32
VLQNHIAVPFIRWFNVYLLNSGCLNTTASLLINPMAKRTISHYRIIREIGHGGMAQVYEAQDLQTGRRVALKVLLPHYASDAIARRRFMREAQVGMQLDHPGITTVYEVNEFDNIPFLTMELIKGSPLNKILKEKKLNLSQCIDIGICVAEVMNAAHAKKIIHRDIKPSNIMICDDTIKVMDFGLARIADTSSLTQRHEILGTLSYMSPEQAIGAPIDARSDIFSLGLLLYEMLAGVQPFRAENAGALIHAILHSDPLRMSELGIAIPVELEQVVFKAISKKPQLRYQTAREMANDLIAIRELLKGKPIKLMATEEVFEEQVRGVYSVLVGRNEEMAVLIAALDRMMHGDGSVILLSGEAGIGKSRMAWELGRKGKQMGARYLTAPCISTGKDYPYKPIIEIIRSFFAVKGIHEPKQLGVFLEQKAPHLMARIENIRSILHTNHDKNVSLLNKEQIWDTFAAIITVMIHDRPVILHIEDLHWADAATLNLLIYLVQSIRMERILIIGTYRADELDLMSRTCQDSMRVFLETIAKRDLGQELVLERLNRTKTRSLVDAVFAGSELPTFLYDSVYDETDGNPLFVLEVLKLLKDEGIIEASDEQWKLKSRVISITIPNRIQEIVERRLDRLGKQENEILEAAAVDGHTFQSDTICAILKLHRIKVLRCLQNMESTHHIIHAMGKGYRFDHHMIQEIIYNRIIPELKREYHKTVAEYTVKQTTHEESDAGIIAYHLANAGMDHESLYYFLKAGEYAQRLYANEEAIRQFDAGLKSASILLAENDSVEVKRLKLKLHKQRAETKTHIGLLAEAQIDGEEALKLAEDIADQDEKASVLYALGLISSIKCKYEEAKQRFNSARQIWKKLGNRSGEGKALDNLGIIYNRCGNPVKALQNHRRAMSIHRESGDKKNEANALGHLAAVNYSCGDYSTGIRQATEAKVLYHGIGDKQGEAIQLANIGSIYYKQGNLKKALSRYMESLDMFERNGALKNRGICMDYIAAIYYKIGQIDKALDYFRKTADLHSLIGNKEQQAQNLGNIGYIQYCRGDIKNAFRYLRDALKIQRQIGNKKNEADTLINIGHAHRFCGNYAKALKAYIKSLEIRREIDNLDGQWDSLHFLFRFYLHLGENEKAYSFFEDSNKIPVSKLTKDSTIMRHTGIGVVKYYNKKPRNVPREIYRGLKAAKEENSVELMIEIQLLIASLQLKTGHYRQCYQYARKALKFANQQGRRPDIAQAMFILAESHYQQREFAEAKSYAEQALETAKSCGMKEIIWRANHVLGKIHKRNRKKEAKHVYAEAKQILESIISKLSGELKQSFLNKSEIKAFYNEFNKIGASKK